MYQFGSTTSVCGVQCAFRVERCTSVNLPVRNGGEKTQEALPHTHMMCPLSHSLFNHAIISKQTLRQGSNDAAWGGDGTSAKRTVIGCSKDDCDPLPLLPAVWGELGVLENRRDALGDRSKLAAITSP
jgi:hypothetical protein